jgi:hypothetical protein
LFGIGTPTSTIEEAPTTNNSHAISNNLHISFMKQNLQKKKKNRIIHGFRKILTYE